MKYWSPQAWVQGEWLTHVLLEADETGHWSDIRPHTPAHSVEQAIRLGLVLPGLVNAHSHAFQRAMAGMAERRHGAAPGDDFWGWRERMYQVALRISPEQLEDVAVFLYQEMLQCGFTHVCEFHYLHRDTQGHAYADPTEMSWALVRAAQRTGIGLTLLPTLYMHSGLGATALTQAQRRFASTPDTVLALQQTLAKHIDQQQLTTLMHAGAAIHSLRAVDGGAMRELAQALPTQPLHIHAAEQSREVQDCLTHLGQRPVEWLLEHVGLDKRWHLIHATHSLPHELQGLAQAGASVVVCPSTEANLGDGVWDMPNAMQQGLTWSIGTDSHVNRAWTTELLGLEYSQRLLHQQRNVAASASVHPSSAAVLFECALNGGSAASGLPLGGICKGQRADFQSFDTRHHALLGIPAMHLLDALVFSSPHALPSQVGVAGRLITPLDSASAWTRTMQALWI